MPTKALIPLPTLLTPVDYTCFELAIPLDVEWRAMFWGALDQLTRWNSYERDTFQRGLAVANTWKEIIGSARESECASPCPGFYIETNDINCPQDVSTRTSRVVNECSSCDGSAERVHFSRSIIPALGVQARIGYSAFDKTDNTPCGGHFCQVRAYSTGIIFPDWTLQWRDCLNVDHSQTFPSTDEIVFNGFDAQWMCLLCTDNFCAAVSISGPVLCAIT